MKKIAILGSTGSIGVQALDVVRKDRDNLGVSILSCNKNTEILKRQIEEFKPEVVYVEDKNSALNIKKEFKYLTVLNGENDLKGFLEKGCYDILLNALVGIRGLIPTYYGIRRGKNIALANKESLVAGGRMIMDLARSNNSQIIPVDSEHSAIFQSMQGNKRENLQRVILTASGGPFKDMNLEQLRNVSVKEALNHPNWSMGSKITIDSATLMNKGLELIEAGMLFDLNEDEIDVVIHPQSILHSAVEYIDGSIIGQMGRPDMKVPISYALTYPNRMKMREKPLNFFEEASNLTFLKVNGDVFKTVDLAREAMKRGHSAQIVLNGANEVLVDLFLRGKIGFLQIQESIRRALDNHRDIQGLDIDKVIEIDKQVRREVQGYFNFI